MLPAGNERDRAHANKGGKSPKIGPCIQRPEPTGTVSAEKVGSPPWWFKKLGLPPQGAQVQSMNFTEECSLFLETNEISPAGFWISLRPESPFLKFLFLHLIMVISILYRS